MINNLFFVGLGGLLGAMARYFIGYQLTLGYSKSGFPFHTLLVNALGCFAIGLIYSYLKSHSAHHSLYLIAGVGFLGAFTTFSAFSIETITLLERGQYLLGSANILSNTLVSLIACLLSLKLGRLLF